MASVVNESNGKRRIDFFGLDGKRRAIRLGRISDRDARLFAANIERLIEAASFARAIEPATIAWLSELPSVMRQKLVGAGLVEATSDSDSVVQLGPYLDGYCERRTADLKPASMLVLGHVVRNLKEFFGVERSLESINAAEADDFQRWLSTTARTRGPSSRSSQGLSSATIAKRLQWAGAFFRDAVRRKLIAENPFDGVRKSGGVNVERQQYVPRETIERILAVAPDAEWRLLICLARYAGLRTPSEPFSLRWSDIDWAENRLSITSPKTEHHGKGRRVMPLLPEVRKPLEEVFEQANEGAEYVLEGLRQRESTKKHGFWSAVNLRTHLLRLIDRAGLNPWPKLWQNLRASAATDMANRFPSYVAAEWLGHTEAIAQAHYWQVTPEHFRQAIDGTNSTIEPASGAILDAQQKAQHGLQKQGEMGPNRPTVEMQKPLESWIPGVPRACSLAVEGLEPTTHGL